MFQKQFVGNYMFTDNSISQKGRSTGRFNGHLRINERNMAYEEILENGL